MAEELDKMAALAQEILDYSKQLEQENLNLKTASAKSAVSEACMNDTCNALKAAGLIREDQVGQVKEAFMKDPEAIHRTVKGILDAQAQTKEASKEAELNGGRLVNDMPKQANVYEDSMDKMQEILGISNY